MFTVKYVSFQRSAIQNADPNSPTLYDRVEQITGDYELVSQEVEDGNIVVFAHREGGAPGMTFGPWNPLDTPEEIAEFEKQSNLAGQGRAPVPRASTHPRPTVYVMNESGATVAKYDL